MGHTLKQECPKLGRDMGRLQVGQVSAVKAYERHWYHSPNDSSLSLLEGMCIGTLHKSKTNLAFILK